MFLVVVKGPQTITYAHTYTKTFTEFKMVPTSINLPSNKPPLFSYCALFGYFHIFVSHSCINETTFFLKREVDFYLNLTYSKTLIININNSNNNKNHSLFKFK